MLPWVHHSHPADRNGEDLNWDAVWQVATRIDPVGWTAEYRIPFSQLRFGPAPSGVERVWGIQIMRDVARRNERDSWSPWKQTDPGFVSFEGDLRGILDIPTPRRLELMPYGAVDESRIRATSHGEHDPLVETRDGVPEQRNRRVEVTVR